MLHAQEQAEPKTFRELVEAAIDEVHVWPTTESTEPARPLIVLRWANNARGSDDGATVLYLHAGRPIACACVFPLRGTIGYEFTSLSPTGVEARRRGDAYPLWQTRGSVVEYQTMAGAPAPDDSATGRLRQVKSLAEQFSAVTLGWDPNDGFREELRLLPRPLYRYEAGNGEAKNSDLIDGVVFAFVTGTDPEVLLLLEAVKQRDAAVWRYGLARRSTAGLEVQHEGKVVWTAERRPPAGDPAKPLYYYSRPIPPDVLRAAQEQQR
jgi:hypothetical protein